VYLLLLPFIADDTSLPIISGITDYIKNNPAAFAIQLACTVLVSVLCLRFARVLQHVTTESLRGGKASDGWGRLLGRVAYFSVLGLGLLLVVGIWGISSNPRRILDQLGQQAPGVLSNLGLTLLVLAIVLSVGRVMQRASISRMTHSRIDMNLSILMSRVIYLGVLGTGVLIILAIWNVQLIVPVTVLGALTFAITFAIQDILKNLVAGVYLLVERPFRIGDEIMVDRYIGQVEDIQMRVTTLRTTTGEQVLIPNGIIFSSALTNNSAYRRRRAMLTITLLEQEQLSTKDCEQVILQALSVVEGVLQDPAPTIQISSALDQKLTLAVYFWVPTDRLDVLSDALFEVKRALPAAEVSVPGLAGAV